MFPGGMNNDILRNLSKPTPIIKNLSLDISQILEDSIIPIKQPIMRQVLGKIFPFLVNLFLINDIKDTQCGFKLFRKNIVEDIFSRQTINRFAFDAEILYTAKLKKYKIKELPITWRNCEGSKVKIFRDSSKMFFSLMKIKFNHFKGVYI